MGTLTDLKKSTHRTKQEKCSIKVGLKIVCLQDTAKSRILIYLVSSVFKAVYGLGEVKIINRLGVKPIKNLKR